MDRSIIYTQENVRGYDIAKAWQDAVKSTGRETQDILGNTITVASGLAATPTSPASLSVNLGVGALYSQAVLDPTSAGDLPVDGGTYFLQGISWATQQVTLSTSALASGQSQWALIEATFAFVDVIRSGDPDGGVLPFYNSANPSVPLQGQGGSGATLNTERTATVSFKVVYGAPATTGSQTPPSADSGYVGLYLIDLTYGQTTITSGEILVAGPSVGTGVPSNYPYAPFLAGLLQSHHNGNPGQAPKINLATEVQGTLPASNLQTSGSFTGTFIGFSTTVTGTVNWILTGNVVTLTFPSVSGTSNSTTFEMSGLPSGLYPSISTDVGMTTGFADNGSNTSAGINISNPVAAIIAFTKYDHSSWTASGLKSINRCSVTYSLV